MRRIFGCGYEQKHKGKAQSENFKTCPQWCLRQLEVNDVYEHITDYKRGALGDVMELPKPLWDYLKILENEQKKWESKQYEN